MLTVGSVIGIQKRSLCAPRGQVKNSFGYTHAVAYPGILFGEGGGSTNSVEDRENVDLGAVAL